MLLPGRVSVVVPVTPSPHRRRIRKTNCRVRAIARYPQLRESPVALEVSSSRLHAIGVFFHRHSSGSVSLIPYPSARFTLRLPHNPCEGANSKCFAAF